MYLRKQCYDSVGFSSGSDAAEGDAEFEFLKRSNRFA